MYTIRDLRNRTKELFDKAQKGEKIVIIRGPERYVLQHESSTSELDKIMRRLEHLEDQFMLMAHPPIQPEMMEPAMEPLEKPCCVGSKRCNHWVWSDQGWYINSLSGRELESIM